MDISIHALCEEGDAWCAGAAVRRRNFYPRPLRGGRPQAIAEDDGEWEFLSTPSARRATETWQTLSRRLWNFYPRPLRGGRLQKVGQGNRRNPISIHALCEEGDGFLLFFFGEFIEISIHALCEEGDPF